MENMKDYYQDETGQWWYKNPIRGNRFRVYEQTCSQCGKKFIERHKQKRCSRACTATSQRGIPRIKREPRICLQCGESYIPTTKRINSRFCTKKCGRKYTGLLRRGRVGPLAYNWKGGTRHGPAGYTRIWVESRGSVLAHRVVMEKIMGRPLLRYEIVHHKNGNTADNDPSNLELFIKRHPPGQRVTDLLEYAHWIIETYGILNGKVDSQVQRQDEKHCPTCTCFLHSK